jgi:ATP-dependent protease Clp ATPase subunit
MGDFMKYEEEIPTIKGFSNTSNNQSKQMTKIDYLNEGLLEDLVISIQNIIELDKPTTKEYIANINKDEDNSLNISKKFLESLNIRLTVEETAIKRISEVIEKNGYAEGQINEIIDKALALAAFEIATNPNTYEELIISEDTISDNSKYKLIKRKK